MNAAKEKLREDTLTILADRQSRGLTTVELARRLARATMTDAPPAEAEVREALAFLEGLRFVRSAYRELGDGLLWFATSEGVQFRERNLP